MSKDAKSPTIFYGWFVVAACFAATFTLGEAMWSYGVFFKPLEQEFNWSRALTSSGYTAFLISYAISAIAGGRLADRYSPRPILIVSAILAGLGISLCSQVHSISQLRFFLFIAGLGGGATWSVPTTTVQRWFNKRQKAGLALGIVIAGIGVGALVFTPLINHIILSYGWRNAYLFFGILVFITIAISSLVIKDSPVEREVLGEEETTPNTPSGQRWTTGKAMRTTAFTGIVLINTIVVIAFQTLSVHLVPYATDADISPTVAAAALGLMGGASVPGRIISGSISDRIGWQRMLALSCFGMALSLPWLLFCKAAWMLYCFVFSYGVFHGARACTNVGIINQFFGISSLGHLIGITSAISMLVGAFAPYVAGFVFDTTGSYFSTFTIITLLLLSAGLIATTMKKPSITLE